MESREEPSNTKSGFLANLKNNLVEFFGWKSGHPIFQRMVTILVIAWLFSVWNRPESVVVTTGPGSITVGLGRQSSTLFLVSAQGASPRTPWFRTGINVHKGDRVLLSASGRVHTSVQQIYDTAKTNKPLIVPWVDPSGLKETTERYPSFSKHSLHQNASAGQLLVGLSKVGVGKPERILAYQPAPTLIDDSPGMSFSIDEGSIDGYELWLTVNDIWLDRKEKYVDREYIDQKVREESTQTKNGKPISNSDLNREINKKLAEKLNEWASVRQYPATWFNDNIGAFVVAMKIDRAPQPLFGVTLPFNLPPGISR